MRVHSKAVLVAAISAVAATVWAADKTWTGNVSTDWDTAGNWSAEGVPAKVSPFDFVIINSAAQYPVLASNAELSGLSMASGTQLTLTSGKTLQIDTLQASTFGGTITVNGTNSLLYLTTGQRDWTVGGTLEFGAGGNFTATTSGYASSRVLTNNGTIRANAGSTIYLPFSTVNGGIVDGAWQARSTIGSIYVGGKYYYNRLTLSNATLGSNFSAASDSTLTANLWLLDSVTNNSTQFTYPAYGNMPLAVSSGSTFTFNGSGSLTLQGQSLGGTGVTTIANNGTHTLGGYGTISPGTINNAGNIRATGGTAATPRTLNASVINSTGGVIVDQDSTLSVGTLQSNAGSTVTMNGGTLTAGTFNMAGALSGHGTIGDVYSTGSIRAIGGTAQANKTLNTGTISGTGTVTVDQYNTLHATGPVHASAVNVQGTLHTDGSDWTIDTLAMAGTVHVDLGQTVTASTSVTATSGSTLTVDGTLTSPTVSVAGTIGGSGTVHSIVSLTGAISPGNSPGTITLDGLTVSDGAQYNFETGDMVDVNGTLTFLPGAKMAVNVAPGTAKGMYLLMTADAVSGTPRFLLDGVETTTFMEGNAIGIVVPEPAILGMIAGASLLTLVRKRQR